MWEGSEARRLWSYVQELKRRLRERMRSEQGRKLEDHGQAKHNPLKGLNKAVMWPDVKHPSRNVSLLGLSADFKQQAKMTKLGASLVAQWERIQLGSIPESGKIPRTRAWQLTAIFLPGESQWTEEPGSLESTRSRRVRYD